MISFILGLFFGKKMLKDSNNNCILRKDNSRNGTSEGSVNDDLG
jgi:hypothetical protein